MAEGGGNGELHLHAPGIVLEGGFFRQSEAAAVGRKSFRLPAAVRSGKDAPHLGRGQNLREAPLVQHHADVFLNGQKFRRGHIRAQRGGGAAVWPQGAHGNPDQGGFSRAVFAHQAADGSGGDGQGHVPKGQTARRICRYAVIQWHYSLCILPYYASSHARRSRSAASVSGMPQPLPNFAAAERCSRIFRSCCSRSRERFGSATKQPLPATVLMKSGRLQLVIGALGGDDGYFQILCKPPDGGQRLSRRQCPRENLVL